ncbi:hypothetical protein JOD67_007109 [Tenggerimyces flavus]|nr:hypothetical protein [Tenggerimyces flavus]
MKVPFIQPRSNLGHRSVIMNVIMKSNPSYTTSPAS